MHTDNPAGRLLHILQEGKKKQTSLACKAIWAELLDVKPDNLALLMSRLGKVMELPEQIINQIKIHYPNQNNTHKHWSAKVNTAFAQQNLNGKWSEFINHIDSHTIDYLSMSVDLLDVKEKTKILSDKELTEIHKKISDLVTEILKMELDENFKKYVLKFLRKVLTAIEEYKISGASPILEAMESTLGHAFIDENYRNNLSGTPVGSKIITALSAIASIVTIAVGLPQLSDTFSLLLENQTK